MSPAHRERLSLATLWVQIVVMALFTTALLAFAAASTASATVPGKNGNLLLALAPSSGMPSSDSYKVAIANTDGTSVESLTPPVSGHALNSIFAPYGHSIAFGNWYLYSQIADGRGIWSYRPGKEAPELVWEMPYSETGDGLNDYDPISFSPDAKSMISTHFGARCGGPNCIVTNYDTSNGIWLHELAHDKTTRILTTQELTPYDTEFFPDGKRILILAADGLHIASVQGRIIRSFEPSPLPQERSFSISPDGRFLVYSANEFEGKIYRLRLADGLVEQLATASVSNGPVYSPDGRKIAYSNDVEISSLSPDHDIWVMNADGSGQHPLTEQPGSEIVLDWARAKPFQIVRYKRRKSFLVVRTWGRGTVSVRGPALVKKKRFAKAAGIVRVPVTPKRFVRRKARRKYKVNVRFTPRGGLPSRKKRFVRF